MRKLQMSSETYFCAFFAQGAWSECILGR